ncbi:MAG TPA: outer membrane lipoprotein chaperone LolA [Oligoflexia bacterium]|nr:outer membrane lipoprotein chaperone LolA [Oligoflexia bacterium]HMP49026.1 outer membrane lipoprotein chaperone LolA [Oligoflexia bacterium]
MFSLNIFIRSFISAVLVCFQASLFSVSLRADDLVSKSSLSATDFDKAFYCEKGSAGQSLKVPRESILPRVQTSYAALSGLGADFSQRSKLLGMGDSLISSGRLLFQRPGKMNWEYLEPNPQHFITDGVHVWYYEPMVNQVTVGELTSTFSSEIPVSFLLGIGRLDDSFELKSVCKNSGGILLELTPRLEDKNLKKFLLLVSEKSFLPIGASVLDVGDTSTEFLFTDLRENPEFGGKEFEFTPPKGVDIVKHKN